MFTAGISTLYQGKSYDKILTYLKGTLCSKFFEQVRCRVEHEKRNSISTSNHILFCLSYKHNSPLLGRKAEFINE